MAEKSLLGMIADPMIKRSIGCDDSEIIIDTLFSAESRSLIARNPNVADWVRMRAPIRREIIMEISKSLPIEVETNQRIAPVFSKHVKDAGENRYRRFLYQLSKEAYVDGLFNNGMKVKNIMKSCYPWILDKIAGNEDLRDNLNSVEEMEKIAVRTFLLYYTFEYGNYIDGVRRLTKGKESQN
jgi:hypothetical protein